MSVPESTATPLFAAPVIGDTPAVVLMKSIKDFGSFAMGAIAAGVAAFVVSVSSDPKHVAPVTPVAPAPVAAPDLTCKCGTSKTSRPFRVTCPTCHYDLTVVPPILPTGDFGKVAKTGTGDMPK